MRIKIVAMTVAVVAVSLLLLTQTLLSPHRVDIVSKAYADDGRSGPSAEEQDDSAVCSVATLNGAYGFFRTGATPLGPLAAVGIATFDGRGTGTARQTIRKNGVTTSDLFTNPAIESPYEVDSDCAARFLNPDGSVFAHAVIVEGGNELFILSLSNGNSVYGVMKKIGKHQH